jgi:hypothetical protein
MLGVPGRSDRCNYLVTVLGLLSGSALYAQGGPPAITPTDLTVILMVFALLIAVAAYGSWVLNSTERDRKRQQIELSNMHDQTSGSKPAAAMEPARGLDIKERGKLVFISYRRHDSTMPVKNCRCGKFFTGIYPL